MKTGFVYGFWHKKYKTFDYVGFTELETIELREDSHIN
jgi:hypothetical protein